LTIYAYLILISSGFTLLVGVSILCGSNVMGSWYLSHDQPHHFYTKPVEPYSMCGK